MRITIKFFAILKDRAGIAEAQLNLPPGTTLAPALEQIKVRYPVIAGDLNRVAVAVNRAYVRGDPVLNDGDELALIPPVSGG